MASTREDNLNVSTFDEKKETAHSVFDLINRSIKYGSKEVHIIMCDNGPWFKGKDVASILGYKKPLDAIDKHVRPKYKSTLFELCSRLNIHTSRMFKGNQKNTIYINEPGLYQLIGSSKLPTAEQFQDWIFEEVLPNLRKNGEYNLNKELEQARQQLAQKNKYIEEKEEEYNRLHNINAELLSYKKLSEKNESIYMVSTRNYIKHGLIKVGRTKNLKARGQTHNTSHPTGDKIKILYEFKVNDSALVESIIHKKINGLRPDKHSEFFMCPYDLLHDIIDLIVNYDCAENEAVNKLIDAVYRLKQQRFTLTDWTSGLDMAIFEENMKLVENVTNAEGEEVEVKRAKFNITTATQPQKDAFIRDCMLAYQKNILEPHATLNWSTFRPHLIDQLIPKSKFKALEWRKTFKEVAKKEDIEIKIKSCFSDCA
jgi:prophage antirepressor-like protein